MSDLKQIADKVLRDFTAYRKYNKAALLYVWHKIKGKDKYPADMPVTGKDLTTMINDIKLYINEPIQDAKEETKDPEVIKDGSGEGDGGGTGDSSTGGDSEPSTDKAKRRRRKHNKVDSQD